MLGFSPWNLLQYRNCRRLFIKLSLSRDKWKGTCDSGAAYSPSQALFSTLDSAMPAETLIEAEPRASASDDV